MFYRILWFSVKHQQESSIGTPVSTPSLNSLTSPSPSHHSRLSQSPCLGSLSHTVNSHWLFILHITYLCIVSFLVTLSIHLTLGLPCSLHVHKSVLYVCVSIAALQINSSVLFLDCIYMYQYMTFIFLFLTYFTLCNRL